MVNKKSTLSNKYNFENTPNFRKTISQFWWLSLKSGFKWRSNYCFAWPVIRWVVLTSVWPNSRVFAGALKSVVQFVSILGPLLIIIREWKDVFKFHTNAIISAPSDYTVNQRRLFAIWVNISKRNFSVSVEFSISFYENAGFT